MADESTDSVVTPEVIEDFRNTSTSDSYHVGDSSNENSAEKSNSANSKPKLVPHYLRASTGSCHDFCKYGNKHSNEEKARKPIRKRIAKSLPSEHFVQIMVSSQQKNKGKVIAHKPPTDNTKNHSPELNPSPDRLSYSRKLKTSLDNKKVIKNRPTTDSKIQLSPDKNYLQKLKISSVAKPHSLKEIAFSGNRPVLLKPKTLSTKKCPSPEPPEIVKSVFFPSKKDETSVKEGSSSADNKMVEAEKKTTLLSSPVKSKPVKMKPLLSSYSENSDGVYWKGRKNSEAEAVGKRTISKKSTAKKVLGTLSPKVPIIRTTCNNSTTKAGNLKSVTCHSKDGNRMRRINKTETHINEEVSEKILHVIKTENVAESRSHENFSIASEADKLVISDKNKSVEISKVPHVKENHKTTLKKTKVAAVSEGNKNGTPLKLKFRNGKVIMDVQTNISSPKRLRFRRPRIVGPEEGKSDLRRRIFKKSIVNDDGGDKTREKVSSEKIVLKHREVKSKKDAQGLLNNVIEETASKLVESRKSKVKALVGAFETVISLQESKPSSHAKNFRLSL